MHLGRSTHCSPPALFLLAAVYQASGTPACGQRLIFSGRQLQDGQALDAAGLQAGSRVHLLLNFGGD